MTYISARIMRALVSLGLLDVTEKGLFTQNESSKSLKNGEMVSDAVLLTV